MKTSIKCQLLRGLTQLDLIISKLHDKTFSKTLSSDMLPLSAHAKIAANFTLRGYCPLLGISAKSFETKQVRKEGIRLYIAQIRQYLESLPEIDQLNSNIMQTDRAGMADINLPEPEFINLYIIPNLYFHISMVYAIAKSCGEPVGKGDFDGYHSYPSGFSFVGQESKNG